MKKNITIFYLLFLLIFTQISHTAGETSLLYDIFTSIASYFAPQAQGNIIIISGASSSGKSSAALALRNLYAEENIPYLLLRLDEILAGFAPKWIDFNPETHDPEKMLPEGFRFIKEAENDYSCFKNRSWKFNS